MEYVFGAVVLALVAFSTYHAFWNPIHEEFDPPNSLELALDRIGWGFQKLAGNVEGQIDETNESMQNTVDGRHELNDSRIERDLKGKAE